MRVVTGYVNGKPQYRDEGPAFARVQGHGGAALGQAHTTFMVHQRSAEPLREKDRRRKERRERVICGAAMGWRNQYTASSILGLICYRAQGHRDSHRSKEVMERDTERRRSWRPLGGFRDDAA